MEPDQASVLRAAHPEERQSPSRTAPLISPRALVVSTFLLAGCWAGPGWSQEVKPSSPYSLRADQPPTGSNIPRRIVEGSQLPFDKRYHELTLEQQNLLKTQYERMSEADEPPYPANGLGPIYKFIAEGQQRLQVRGQLTMIVDVDARGQAKSVSVLQSPDPEMTNLVAAILVLEKYKPGMCAGTPCSMQFPFRMNFAVRH